MTNPPDASYSGASSRHAEQTKARYARKRLNAEVERLRRLGVDEAWIESVTAASPTKVLR